MTETTPVEKDATATSASSEAGGDEQFSPDQTLSPEFVRNVSQAIEAGDADAFDGLTTGLHPADIADLIGLLPEDEREGLVKLQGGAIQPDVLAELDDDLVEDIVEAMGTERAAEAVAELETDDAAFILEEIDEEQRAKILAEVPLEDRQRGATHRHAGLASDTQGRRV